MYFFSSLFRVVSVFIKFVIYFLIYVFMSFVLSLVRSFLLPLVISLCCCLLRYVFLSLFGRYLVIEFVRYLFLY